MSESETHKRLKKVACAYLKRMCTDIVCDEVKFKNIRSFADACALNFKRKEVRVIEVKATLKDYLRDKKLFDIDKSYYRHCHYFYIMCPNNVIPLDKVPKEYGLLYVNNDNKITLVQKPIKNIKLKTRFDTTLKLACKQITNELIYKYMECQKLVDFLKTKKRKI